MMFFKRAIISSCAVFAFFSVTAAEDWKLNINTNLTTAFNSYSDSWSGGEAGSFNWAAQFLGIAEKPFTEKINSRTTLKLQFGQTKVQNKTSKRVSTRKSSDQIDLEDLFVSLSGMG
jgi:hypothetical protein